MDSVLQETINTQEQETRPVEHMTQSRSRMAWLADAGLS